MGVGGGGGQREASPPVHCTFWFRFLPLFCWLPPLCPYSKILSNVVYVYNCFLFLHLPTILEIPYTSPPFPPGFPLSLPPPQCNCLVLSVSKLFWEGRLPTPFESPQESLLAGYSRSIVPYLKELSNVTSECYTLYLKKALIRQFPKYTPWKPHKICKIDLTEMTTNI